MAVFYSRVYFSLLLSLCLLFGVFACFVILVFLGTRDRRELRRPKVCCFDDSLTGCSYMGWLLNPLCLIGFLYIRGGMSKKG